MLLLIMHLFMFRIFFLWSIFQNQALQEHWKRHKEVIGLYLLTKIRLFMSNKCAIWKSKIKSFGRKTLDVSNDLAMRKKYNGLII